MRKDVFVVIAPVSKRMRHMAVLCHVCPHTWRLFAHMCIHHCIHPQIFTEHPVCPGTDLIMGDNTMNKAGKVSVLMGLTFY